MYIVGEGNGGLEKEYQRYVYIYLHRSVYVYIPKDYLCESKRRKKIKRINLIVLHAQTDIRYKTKRVCYA